MLFIKMINTGANTLNSIHCVTTMFNDPAEHFAEGRLSSVVGQENERLLRDAEYEAAARRHEKEQRQSQSPVRAPSVSMSSCE